MGGDVGSDLAGGFRGLAGLLCEAFRDAGEELDEYRFQFWGHGVGFGVVVGGIAG